MAGLLEGKNAMLEAVATEIRAARGAVDVSFNQIARGDSQGTPLVGTEADELLRAVVNGLRGNFLTARAAARRLIGQRSGVILQVNSASGVGARPGASGITGSVADVTAGLVRR